MRTLTDERRIRRGRVISGSGVVLSVAGLFVAIALGRWEIAWLVLAPVNALVGVGFGALAWTVLPKHPRNGSVWAYTWAAFFGGLFSTFLAVLVLSAPASLLDQGADASFVPAEVPWPAAISLGAMVSIWLPTLFLPLTLGLLLFPDGRLPSPRWRWVGWYQATTIALAVVGSFALSNPWSTNEVAKVTTTFGTVVEVVINLAQFGVLLAVASLVVRYRRGDLVVRRQIRWIALGGAMVFAGTAAILVIRGGLSGAGDPTVENVINLVPLVLLIASFWVAVTKYRLYEIDVIVSKSVAYLGLAAGIAGLYAAVVIAPLLVIGRADDGDPGLVLPIVAAAVVALLFEPIRSRMQRWANRLVYGDRASPYEVLSQITSGLSDVTAGSGTDDLARLLAQGTGAEQAVVWIRRGEALNPVGVFRAGGSAVIDPVPTDGLVDDEFNESRAVHYRDEQIGALSLTKPRNDQITPADRELLSDVAAGAGLLLRNIALNRELEQRAHEVRASRQRLIAAQDAERHRLERDLHDGAQQQVVALKVKLGIAKTIAEREGADQIAALVIGLAEETQQAVDALRSVAHGIYPPLLESEGLETAVRAIERTSSIPVVVEVAELGRYGRHVEETIYFCVLETLERARMAGARDARVELAGSDGELCVCVDLGRHATHLDLTAVADRIDAAGGTLVVTNRPDSGQLITASLPLLPVPTLVDSEAVPA